MIKCKVCGTPTDRPKYCSDSCQRKAWKLRNRDKYLEGKKRYRDKNKKKIREYQKFWKTVNPEKVKKYRRNYASKKRSD